MQLRTRVAFVVITLLVGWVIASPFHTFTGTPESTPSDNDQQTSPPALQIQATTTTQFTSEPSSRDSRWSPERWSSDVAPTSDAIPAGQTSRFGPELQQVSPVSSQASPVQPMLLDTQPSSKPQPLTPVKLLGVDFDRDRGELRPVVNNSFSRQEVMAHDGAPAGVQTRPRLGDAGGPRPGGSDPRLDSPIPKTWHRIVNGDSLPSLAKAYWGDASLALLIYEANRDVLASPDILPIGTELRIPHRPHDTGRSSTARPNTIPVRDGYLTPPEPSIDRTSRW